MSTLRKKIIEIRAQEALSQQEFCELTGAGLSAIKALEAGRTDQLNTKTLLAITNHPRFKKYVLYLMCDSENKVTQTKPTPLPGVSEHFVTLLAKLTIKEKRQVEKYIEFLLFQGKKS